MRYDRNMDNKNPQVLLHLAPYLRPSPETMLERAGSDDVILQRHISCAKAWDKVFLPEDYSEGFGDYEEWIEQTYRLMAAIDAFGEENVWVIKGSESNSAINLTTGEKLTEGMATKDFIIYGSQPKNVYYRETQEGERVADFYATTDVFAKFANRKFYVCGFGLDEGSKGIEIVDAVLTLHAENVRRIIVKNTKAKKGFWDIVLPDDLTADSAYRLLFDELDWVLIREEGSPKGFLVQEYSPMFYEYRFFVVNHQLTTGAGCIEENTPLNNSEPFDPWFRKVRKEVGSPLVRDDKMRDVLKAFAQRVIDYTKESENKCQNYVVDVAVDRFGIPLMIERNAMLNSGFYASNPSLITAVLRGLSAPVGA